MQNVAMIKKFLTIQYRAIHNITNLFLHTIVLIEHIAKT